MTIRRLKTAAMHRWPSLGGVSFVGDAEPYRDGAAPLPRRAAVLHGSVNYDVCPAAPAESAANARQGVGMPAPFARTSRGVERQHSPFCVAQSLTWH